MKKVVNFIDAKKRKFDIRGIGKEGNLSKLNPALSWQ